MEWTLLYRSTAREHVQVTAAAAAAAYPGVVGCPVLCCFHDGQSGCCLLCCLLGRLFHSNRESGFYRFGGNDICPLGHRLGTYTYMSHKHTNEA